MKKISATILDFGKPLLEVVPRGAPMETRREAIQIVITVWNCFVFEEWGDPTPMEDFRAALEKGPPAARELLHGAMGVLKLRKKLRYPKTRLLVGKWELKDLGDGEVSLYAEAHAPPSER